jgi:hypothetical protein
MLAEQAGVPSNEIIRGRFKPDDFDRMREGRDRAKAPALH